MPEELDIAQMFIYVDERESLIGCYSLCEMDSETVALKHLCIHPAYRHQKFGEKLLLHAVREGMARGDQTMVTDISCENEKLRAWYEKYGFVQEKTEQATLLHMTKRLFSGD